MLYKSMQLPGRLQAMGVIDRFMRTPRGTLEHVLSLSINTSAEGMVVVILSIDTLDSNHQVVAAMPIAVYPMSQQPDAQEDALLVSRKLELNLRRGTTGVGWECVRLVDEEPVNHRLEVEV